MKLEDFPQIFEKSSSIKFMKISPVGAGCPCGRTEWHRGRQTDKKAKRQT